MLPCVQLSRTIVTMSLCAECGSMCPHHHHHHQLSSLTFAVAALLLSALLLPSVMSVESPGLVLLVRAGLFWAGCCRSCSISMHAPPTSAPPPTVTPHLDTCISTLALDIYTGTTYLHQIQDAQHSAPPCCSTAHAHTAAHLCSSGLGAPCVPPCHANGVLM